jgi:hypothetical protein
VRIVLDEMLPVGVAELLPDHEVVTAKAAGYGGLTNGELLRRAVEDGFIVLLTADRNLPAQQNLARSEIGVVLVPGSRMAEIEAKAGAIRGAVADVSRGTVVRVGRD